ncbi:MAG: type II toxin-antitoxin system VapC family toxin [Acidobacteria bacterium]|nr:type II toxin-antitoxin system VapC family toxin [Acidobacteriota bacterium]
MKLLLDTHIWLWSKLEPRRLGRRVTAELSNVDNELWISPVSVWEALVLMQKGRVRVENPFAWVDRAVEQLHEAPLTREIVSTGLALPLAHADPADRFLAATAKILKLTLVTADQRLLGWGEIASLANR